MTPTAHHVFEVYSAIGCIRSILRFFRRYAPTRPEPFAISAPISYRRPPSDK
jgi:hypothetical protein